MGIKCRRVFLSAIEEFKSLFGTVTPKIIQAIILIWLAFSCGMVSAKYEGEARCTSTNNMSGYCDINPRSGGTRSCIVTAEGSAKGSSSAGVPWINMEMDYNGNHCNSNWGVHVTGTYGNSFSTSGKCTVSVSSSDSTIRVNAIARNKLADAKYFTMKKDCFFTPYACEYSFTGGDTQITPSGGSASIEVIAEPSGCSRGSWTASSNASWLTITSGSGGPGSGTVIFSATRNTSGANRTGRISLSGCSNKCSVNVFQENDMLWLPKYPVHRFTSANDRFYTIDENEKNSIVQNLPDYSFEGIAFDAFKTQQTGTSPVFRFTSANDRFFTIDENEKNYIMQNLRDYTYEGVGFYAYKTQQSGTSPVHRFTSANDRFYTIDGNEKDYIIRNLPAYRYEGVAFYAYPTTTTLPTYTVTPSAGAGGAISPAAAQTIVANGRTSFTITPNAGYTISSVTGCGGTLSGNTYATAPVTQNCTVSASFTATNSGGGGGGGGGNGGGTIQPQESGSDIPGVKVYGTGKLGKDSIKVVISGSAVLNVRAGQYFEAKDGSYQRMMVASDYLLREGSHYITANCMQHEKKTPANNSEFFSMPKSPSGSIHECQVSCGNNQNCIWSCQSGGGGGGSTSGTVTWQVKNNCSRYSPVYFRFFNNDKNLVYPDSNTSYTATYNVEYSPVRLNCTTGDQICIGGSNINSFNPSGSFHYWGVGLDGNEGCNGCCVSCDGKTYPYNFGC